MKKSISKLGKVLNKKEQKAINGGANGIVEELCEDGGGCCCGNTCVEGVCFYVAARSRSSFGV